MCFIKHLFSFLQGVYIGTEFLGWIITLFCNGNRL